MTMYIKIDKVNINTLAYVKLFWEVNKNILSFDMAFCRKIKYLFILNSRGFVKPVLKEF